MIGGGSNLSFNEKRQLADLHMHSTSSDGAYSPKQLMEKCYTAGLSIVSLTDHDTTNGLNEAAHWAKHYGMTFIPGIELSTRVNGVSVDILGYGIDQQNEFFQRSLQTYRKLRIERMEKMVEKCCEHGLQVTFDEVKQYVKGDTFSRPHLAEALVNKGYVTTKKEAFDKYIASDKPCYVRKEKELTPKEAIQLIHEAQGVAIVAHPVFYSLDDEILQWLIEDDLDGIEIYHRDHDEKAMERFLLLAEKAKAHGKGDILYTGGSDFHDEKFGRNGEELGKTKLPFEQAVILLEKLNL